ncbi:phosphoribosyltransferase [Photorhabdus aegyptia]|uniref:phosphoribosyltransferase n=1 Tax=Photorhabdus aegyptia TaxID=2805098 RepID=UPI001E2D0939|nr:phosphoribosyltransferase [Photorhabdus aegyptia]MCC8458665.1 phosphoribosyltransferase [Photorhabdus aegyptia]
MPEYLSPALDLRSIGLLGELRSVPETRYLTKEVMALPGLLTEKPAFVGSRGAAYYEPKPCHELLMTAKYYTEYISQLECSDKLCTAPSKYILADHSLAKLLRIVDSLLSSPQTVNEDIVPFIDGIKECAKVVSSTLMGTAFTFSPSPIHDLTLPSSTEHKVPRPFIEGDNHLLTLAAAQIDKCLNSSVVGIMLGGSAAAAVTAAAWDSELNLVKVSRYDDTACKSTHLWGRNIPPGQTVTIIDDNCGTGDTLCQAIDLVMAQTGRRPKARAVELHWEKLLRTRVYGHSDRVFNPETLDVLTPWCFRHHQVLNRLVHQPFTDDKYAHTTTADWVAYSYSLLSVLHDTLTDSTWAAKLLRFLLNLKAQTPLNYEQPIDAFKALAYQCPECSAHKNEFGKGGVN